jgi:molybdopterin-guanine dinucleotide biosynthesis protein A
MTEGSSSGVRRGLILAGRATRLPQKFESIVGGARVVDRAVSAVRAAGLAPTILSVRPLSAPTAPVRADLLDAGPLGALRGSGELVRAPFFLAGADMPLLDAVSIRALVELHRPGRSVVPRHPDGTREVLHAVYDLAPGDLDRAWARGRSLRGLVAVLEERGAVDFPSVERFDARTFWDVDTPDDLDRARAWIERSGVPSGERARERPDAV